MKSAYVADLQPDQAVSSLFLVRDKEIRTSSATGKSWLQLELVLLHFRDDLDSKMDAMRATLESKDGTGSWTARNPSLRRSLLRADEFLHSGEAGGVSNESPKSAGGQKAAGK